MKENQEINSQLAQYIDKSGNSMSSEEQKTILKRLIKIENKLDCLSRIETKINRILEEK